MASNVSEIQKAGLLAIASGNIYAAKLNTKVALHKKGLTAYPGGHVRLTDAGLALFEGETFRVFYAAFVDGKRVERNWTSGVTLAQAIAEIADLRDLGPGDPDAVQFYGITAC